jgi:hypothetical protein
MTFSNNNRLNLSAFAIATVAFMALHGSMLMGFEQLASRVQNSIDSDAQVAISHASSRKLVLERVVISTRRA